MLTKTPLLVRHSSRRGHRLLLLEHGLGRLLARLRPLALQSGTFDPGDPALGATGGGPQLDGRATGQQHYVSRYCPRPPVSCLDAVRDRAAGRVH